MQSESDRFKVTFTIGGSGVKVVVRGSTQL